MADSCAAGPSEIETFFVFTFLSVFFFYFVSHVTRDIIGIGSAEVHALCGDEAMDVEKKKKKKCGIQNHIT